MPQVADRVEAAREREELKRDRKNSDTPSKPNTTDPATGELEAVFRALIRQQRAERKGQSAGKRNRVELVGRDVQPTAAADEHGQNQEQPV